VLAGCAQNPYSVEVQTQGQPRVSDHRELAVLDNGAEKSVRQDVQPYAGKRAGQVGENTVGRSGIKSHQIDTHVEPERLSKLSTLFAPAPYKPNPAVLALIDRASISGRKGDYQSAGVSLERALRISPKDLGVYRLLVELKIQKGEMNSAVELARKGLSIGVGKAQQTEKRQLQRLLDQLLGS